MDGRKKRTLRIIDRIKQSALQMFASNTMDKISMDDIASNAGVSKVTIYKYFHNKDELLNEVINLYVEQILTATENTLNSEMSFLEKLRFIMLAKIDKPQMVSTNYLLDLIEKDKQAEGRLNEALKKIIFKFFEAGKKEGYIEESLPFELLYLHSEIYRAGLKAKSIDLAAALIDKEAIEQMTNLYFLGIIKTSGSAK